MNLDLESLPDYAELHCISNFTFLRGVSHPHELVERAAQLGYRALALTDECSLAGVVRAHVRARQVGLPLIIGSELQLADGPRLVILAQNRAGYGRLAELITRARRRAVKGKYTVRRADLAAGLAGCLVLWLPDPVAYARDPRPAQRRARTEAAWLRAVFASRVWIGLELLLGPNDAAWAAHVRTLAAECRIPIAAAGAVHMHERRRRVLQDVVTAIRLGVGVAQAGYALQANGERYLRSRQRLARIYDAASLRASVDIAERCTFSLEELRYQYPDDMVPPDVSPRDYLRRLTLAGMARRWPQGAPPAVRALVEQELGIIAELAYEPYFLTTYDIVQFARGRGILCQGRGSAANSAVCYCLGITAVDPSRMEMLFERFVSKERNEPPDIDVDFEHERREEVIQYIYEKYGRHRAALAATIITYRRKSALRDVGKALGMSVAQIERLSGALAWWDAQVPAEQIRAAGLDPANPVVIRLLELVQELQGFPRHLSQHVGGFVIARGPLAQLVPIENAAMAERTVIQWDKDDLDAVGLLKVDCLSLGMLSAIRRAFDLIAQHRGRRWTLASLPAEDPAVYHMIQQADTVGVFQIESRAQMSMLPRLRPACFYDLVIEIAIVRPGPIQGQMVHPYLKRRQGLEPVRYPSEAVRGVLERTLGVPIFQEQVIKLAMVAAGFSAGEADQLRRAIGSWRRTGRLQAMEQRLIAGMQARGYAPEFAQQLCKQIQGFGEYGFPESHSASFALLAYVSAWLKCHEPAAFVCALLNSQPMGFYAPAQLLQDARRHGVVTRPVDVLHSVWDCTLENVGSTSNAKSGVRAEHGDLALRLGLRMVKGLSAAAAERIRAARRERVFTQVTDLACRAHLGRKDLEALAAAGALAGLAGNRHQARWQVLGQAAPPALFAQTAPEPQATPLLPRPTEGEDILADYRALGFTLGRHPLALLRARLTRLGSITAADLAEARHGQQVLLVGLVNNRQHPASAAGVIFMTLEDETGVANIVVWERLSVQYRQAVLQARLLGVRGEVQREGAVVHLVARQLQDHSAWLGELITPCRNFH